MTAQRLNLNRLEDRALPAPLFGSAVTFDSADQSYADTLASDGSGSVYVAGTFEGTIDVDPGAGVVSFNSEATGNGYVAKYTTAGALAWAKAVGEGGGIIDQHMARDDAGNLYLAGTFAGDPDVNPGAGVFRLNTPTIIQSAFIVSFTPAGDFRWAKQVTPSGTIAVGGIVAVPGGVVVVGSFAGTADFNPDAGTASHTSAGNFDTYALKLTSAGAFTWARAWGGAGRERGLGVAADAAGNVYATGLFGGTADLDPGPATATFTARGQSDAFLVKLDSGGALAWARAWGGTGTDTGQAVAIGPEGDVRVSGVFEGAVDFDPGPGAKVLQSPAGFDGMYLNRFSAAGNLVWARAMIGSGFADTTGLALDPAGNTYLTGYVAGPAVDFDPGPAVNRFAIPGAAIHGFVAKYDPAGRHVWAQIFKGNDVGTEAVAVTAGGDVYTAGEIFSGPADLDPGPGTVTRTSPRPGTPAMFLVKLTQPTGPLAYTAPTGNGADDLILRRRGKVVELYDVRARKVVAARPFDEVSSVTVTGTADEDDRLTVDYSGGGFWPAGGITFTGGANGTDSLRVKGADADYVLTDTRLTSPVGPAITVSGLERAEIAGGAGPNLLHALAFSGSVVLSGGSGDDQLFGAAGPSTL